MKDDMDLPEGRTCRSCAHIKNCQLLFRCKVENTRCDWAPSRYQEYHAPAAYPIDPSAECSAAALEKVDAKKLEALAEAYYAAKDEGHTADEVAEALVARGDAVDALSVRPRVSALKKRRILFPTGERRTNGKGNTCAILVHRMYWKGVL